MISWHWSPFTSQFTLQLPRVDGWMGRRMGLLLEQTSASATWQKKTSRVFHHSRVNEYFSGHLGTAGTTVNTATQGYTSSAIYPASRIFTSCESPANNSHGPLFSVCFLKVLKAVLSVSATFTHTSDCWSVGFTMWHWTQSLFTQTDVVPLSYTTL